MSRWTISTQEFALQNVINAGLQDITVRGTAQLGYKSGRPNLQETDLPAGGFTGPLSDGLLVPSGDAAKVMAEMKAALLASGTLKSGEFTISQSEAPQWAAKQGKVKLLVEVPDMEKVDISAAAKYLESAPDTTSRIMGQALRSKSAQAHVG